MILLVPLVELKAIWISITDQAKAVMTARKVICQNFKMVAADFVIKNRNSIEPP